MTECKRNRGEPLLIAICPDWEGKTEPERRFVSYARAWANAAKSAGHGVRLVNIMKSDAIEQIAGCDGLMWKFTFTARARDMARHILPAIEYGLGIPTYPSLKTAWHFDDKLSQFYLLSAAGIRMPKTWIFWTKEAALRFLEKAPYPFVTKLATGFKSRNVCLVTSFDQGQAYVEKLFDNGIASFDSDREAAPKELALTGRQRGYFYAQEFVRGNDHDTRVTIIGNRAFAFRRFNRPDDFRASGSGLIDRNPDAIDLEAVRFGFRVARRLGTQSLTLDILRREEELLLLEVNYTFDPFHVRICPGHWVSADDSSELSWCSGSCGPEEAIFADFVHTMSVAKTARSARGGNKCAMT